MSDLVADASAILACLHGEPGGEVAARHLPGAVVSAVNLAEVGARLADRGVPDEAARRAIVSLGMVIAPFDEDLAYASAALRPATRRLGLSLGDRACLALARQLAAPVLTADRAWSELEIGVEVMLVRD